MEKSIKNKILASILIFILVLANMQAIIIEGITVYASSIENQNNETNHKNVNFNAQFMVINNEKKYSIRENISNNEIFLNIFTEVKEAGYLKTGKITIKDEEGKNANFNLVEIEEPDTIQNIDYNKNEIDLNQINNGENIDINIPIKLITGEVFNLDEFSKNTVLTFDGIYVDGKGEEKNIEKEINLKAEWKEDTVAVLNQETIKVIPYELEEKGILITEKVCLGVEEQKLPIKSAKLDIKVPELNGILPTEVRVQNTNTNMDLIKDYKDGKLSIVLENKTSENNIVIWNKALEELEVTYIFDNTQTEEITEVNSEAKLELECYSSEIKTLNAETNNVIDISNKLGNVIEIKEEEASLIEKGYMLNTKNETEFTVETNLVIAYEKLVEKVDAKYNKDKFILGEKKLEADTYYKQIKVEKENLVNLLGETGEIIIYSLDVVLGSINNTTQEDENGYIIFNLSDNLTNEIKVETTKPIYSGELELVFIKAIKTNKEYTSKQIKDITALSMEVQVGEEIKEHIIPMQNPTTKFGLDINTNILSTVVENKGVEFTVTLNNNTLACDLFKNPKLELCMPEAVTDVKINSVKLLLEDELEIENYEYNKDTNSIIINLKGTQTKYNLNELEYGATVIVNTDIVLDKLEANKKDKVKLYVINEAVTSYESVLDEKGYLEKDINIVAPLGLIALNSAEGYNENLDEATSISGNEAVGKIEPNAEAQMATMKITAINNYDSVINNIRILGRIPFEGNKSLIDGTDLGTTFDAILKEKISTEILLPEKFDVYYSENGEATEDLNNDINSWVLEPEDLSKVKSYLIILKDYEMQIGDKIEFKYEIEVPAGLELGNSAHGTYIVYYDNKKDDVVFENNSVQTVVGLTTGEAPKLEVTINSDIAENEIARSGQIIRYTIKVKNTGTVDAKQIFVTTDISEGLTYAELVLGGNYGEDYYKEYPEKTNFNKLIGDLNVGQEETIEYFVKVKKVEQQKEILNKVKVSAKDLPEMIESNEIKNIIDSGSMQVELKSNVKQDKKVKIGETITYKGKISNVSNYDINNVIAKVELPEGVEYKTSSENSRYNKETRTIEWNVGKLQKQEKVELSFELTAAKKQDNVEISLKSAGENVEEHKSNVLKLDVCKSEITVKQESTIPEGYVSYGDKIEYKIEVTNNGNLDATNVQVIDLLPDGMKYLETSYQLKGINKTIKNSNSDEVKLELNIPAEETLSMNVLVKVDETNTEKQASNIVKVINGDEELNANTLTHIIEAKTLANNGNGENGNSQDGTNSIEIVDTYKISGTAWLDGNKNGVKDEGESNLAGITVMLLDKETGQIAKDANSQDLNTVTEGNGNYTFRNLRPGSYMALFIYDNTKYMITDYKKAEVEESKNSDVVNMSITMNEEEKVVAVSDVISITENNIYNIDIGLKEIGGFDLELSKYISKITVKNSKGTKVYDYTNTQLAKIEIDSKISNESTLIIEYKIAVTNEGSIEGYAKKIVDYIPKELKFSSELNSNWYLAEDGNVYSSELANTKINPGETKEVTLILTKQITGENVGLINNNAEIVESYNDYGTEDVDSKAGSKQTNEDDMSNADIYIGIKTGSPVTYIGLSLIIMVALAVGAYLINTKILIKK